MLNGVKLRGLYSKIQNKLFYMIPEKWNRIYLYASVIESSNHIERGEMFFYYYPSGLLKKNPVNVYEVPAKFNVDEKAYMKLVDELYSIIKELKREFVLSREKPWTNLTISIVDLQFRIEYDYSDLSELTSDEIHLIWQHKYLGLPIERIPKKERKLLEEYLKNEKNENIKTEQHIENVYKQHIHNIVEYDREEVPEGIDKKHKNKNLEENINYKKMDKYELYKLKQAQKEQKEEQYEDKTKEQSKNQILNF